MVVLFDPWFALFLLRIVMVSGLNWLRVVNSVLWAHRAAILVEWQVKPSRFSRWCFKAFPFITSRASSAMSLGTSINVF